MLTRLCATLALAAGMLVLAAPAAHAEEPVDLGGAYVLDAVGALDGERAAVDEALDSLYERAGVQLFVVYVDTFDNPGDAVEWADETAFQNNFGSNDLLLAVAVDDRQYAISIDPQFPLSDSQLDAVEVAIEGRLRDSDWSGAAIAGAQSLEAQSGGVTDNGETASPSSVPWLPIAGGIAVVAVGAVIVWRVRARRKERETPLAAGQPSQKDLDRRAGTLLVQLDDSLKTSEQELGFAVAQFGDAATADFAAALASAKAKVAEAFTLQQQLDDAHPDSPADEHAWTIRIIELCEAADAELDAQADAFDELRELEKNAPQELVAVRSEAQAERRRAADASAAMAALASTYAASAVAPVAGNLDQAAKLLEFAEAAAAAAQSAIEGGRPSEAAIAVRTARASIGQATSLHNAVDVLAANLTDAAGNLTAAVTDTEQDIREAQALEADPALTPVIAAASRALAAITPGDPVAGLALVGTANAELERVFTGVRDQQQRVSKARAQLEGSLSGARSQVRSATEYITTRRGGIGSTARTRVSEAERNLAEATALGATDPVGALEAAQRATALAASALQSARYDVSAYESRESASYSDSSYPSGSDGADLGGILGDWLFGGGGGSGGGWSSGGSSSRSSRSSRSGSFGGSSRSSSRRSSGGGGRSRGGRF